MPTAGERRMWTIDVCLTCDREAKWPFCEHKPEGYQPPGTPPWCAPVVVVPRTVSERIRPPA